MRENNTGIHTYTRIHICIYIDINISYACEGILHHFINILLHRFIMLILILTRMHHFSKILTIINMDRSAMNHYTRTDH